VEGDFVDEAASFVAFGAGYHWALFTSIVELRFFFFFFFLNKAEKVGRRRGNLSHATVRKRTVMKILAKGLVPQRLVIFFEDLRGNPFADMMNFIERLASLSGTKYFCLV